MTDAQLTEGKILKDTIKDLTDSMQYAENLRPLSSQKVYSFHSLAGVVVSVEDFAAIRMQIIEAGKRYITQLEKQFEKL